MPSFGNIIMRAQFTDLFASRLPYIDEILYENFDAPSLVYPQIFNVRDSRRAFEEITGITGFGLFTETGEGEVVTYDTLLQGYDKRFTHLKYTKACQITMEAREDDLDGAIVNQMPPLARSARVSIETIVAADLNLGFSTATTPDGVAAFSDSHPLVGGGVADNLVSSDFSQASLETAINLFDEMKDDRSLPIEGAPSKLVYPPRLRWIVNEVLKSQLRSDTALNTINVVNQLGLGQVEWKFLTSNTDWFLMSEPDRHRLLFYWRMEPAADHTMDFETGNMKTKMTFRLSHGFADWRNIVGGDGT